VANKKMVKATAARNKKKLKPKGFDKTPYYACSICEEVFYTLDAAQRHCHYCH
jgi:hypothetical protein